MFLRVLPILIVAGCLFLVAHSPGSAGAQNKPDELRISPFYVQSGDPDAIKQNVSIETFNLPDANGNRSLSAINSAPSGTDNVSPSASSTLRISQVYVRGGEPGATFQNDFVEIFNAGSSPVNINNWGVAVISSEGLPTQIAGARFTGSFLVPPGMHLLLRFKGNGTNGQPTPGEYPIITDVTLGSTSGQIMLLSPSQNPPSGCPTSFGDNGVVTDFVGYGTAACSEGSLAPVPPSNQSLTRINGGCTDTDNNASDFQLSNPNPRISTSAVTPCGSSSPTPTPTPTPTPGSSPTPTPTPTATPTPSPGDTNIRISQVYARGGETGATFQRDFIELFNRGNTTIDIQGWALIIVNFDTSPPTIIGGRVTGSFPMKPGQHVFLTMPGNGSNGQALTGDANIDFTSLGSTGGEVFLIARDKTPNVFSCPEVTPDPTGAIVDYVGYGTATCFEGDAAALPPTNKSLTRIAGGCTDTDDNAADFVLSDPNPRGFSSTATPCGSQATSTIAFSASQYNVTEGTPAAHITVTRSGDLSASATIDYATSDGTALERSDYNTTLGTLRFAVGESQKTFDVLITDDGLQEPTETVTLTLTKPTGNGTLGAPGSATLAILDNDFSNANPVDNSSFFVEQHYHDFLNRASDASGLQFWINNIESCGSDANCRQVKRIDTSAAFFISIEFQKTGFLVYRAYKAAFPQSAQRPRGLPRYREFMRDTQALSRGVIVGNPGFEALLESNTVAGFNAFVARDEFVAAYPASMSPSDYVDTLNAHAGNVLTGTERTDLINGLLSLKDTRATVLRKIAENQAFSNAEFNRAFVLMQYFGYLRRNPDDAPDNDFSGFDFWLGKLNQFGGDYRAAEMVKAFINTPEYRHRFGP